MKNQKAMVRDNKVDAAVQNDVSATTQRRQQAMNHNEKSSTKILHNQKEQKEIQSQSTTARIPDTSTMDAESIYNFYKEHIFPAIMSSFPILLRRIWTDVIAWITLAAHELYLFILPTWWKEKRQRQIIEGDDDDNNSLVESYQNWLLHTQKHLWDQAIASTNRVNATIAEFMLYHFDTNKDGHISANELLNMTELFEKFPQTTNIVITRAPESFWMWFSREWPLMDWKVGVFLWQTFGGLLLVIAVLSIVPGRLHSWSGKILRWPVLGLTYLLIGVELVVYIAIRIIIRVAETVFATPKHRALRRKMATAKSYEEWYQYAAALDLSQKRDKWQRTISDSTSYQYNWPLIQKLMADMKEARQRQDVIWALAVLQQCTRKNVGGIMSEDLFTKTYTGEPKFLVIEFIGEVTKTLHWVTEQVMSADAAGEDGGGTENDDTGEVLKSYEKSFQRKSRDEREHLWQSLIGLAINVATLNFNGDDGGENKDAEKIKQKANTNDTPSSPTRSTASAAGTGDVDESYASVGDLMSAASEAGSGPTMAHRDQLLIFLKRARASYGRTALCLSGGAMMGLYHFGHLQGLMETDCLPNIVSGCSAGSVIGAVLCTRTNDELQHDLDPQVIGPHMKCFARSWPDRIVSLWKTGNLFSDKDWQEMIRWYVQVISTK
jgi:uncharacterized membrane protein